MAIVVIVRVTALAASKLDPHFGAYVCALGPLVFMGGAMWLLARMFVTFVEGNGPLGAVHFFETTLYVLTLAGYGAYLTSTLLVQFLPADTPSGFFMFAPVASIFLGFFLGCDWDNIFTSDVDEDPY